MSPAARGTSSGTYCALVNSQNLSFANIQEQFEGRVELVENMF